MYKILTSILSDRCYSHLVNYNLLPSEQKDCRKGSYGCKDQLLINKAILEDMKTRKKNLSTAWVDYKKAFDSTPHRLLLKCLEIYKISPKMKDFIKASMTKWKTTLTLTHDKGTISSREIRINSGIFQGDSLSPLFFFIVLAPLSSLLNEINYGYKISNANITHLFTWTIWKPMPSLMKTRKAYLKLSKCKVKNTIGRSVTHPEKNTTKPHYNEVLPAEEGRTQFARS